MSKLLINKSIGSLWTRFMKPVNSVLYKNKTKPLWFSTTTIRLESTPKTADADEKPIVYTKSKAFGYKASENFRVKEEELSYNPHSKMIVNLSILLFLFYFCMIREPNDVDDLLSRDLFQIMPDLELPMFEAELKRMESLGLDTTKTKQKLEELKKLEISNGQSSSTSSQ